MRRTGIRCSTCRSPRACCTIPVPKTGTEEAFHKLPDFIANEKNEARHRWHWRFDTPEKFQAMMKNYYRMATEVDTTCGRVLAQLAKDGLLENTLVIFTADNGNSHGEHQLADKWYPYEESLRVPLIIHDPRMPRKMSGKTNDDFALNVDLAPTILAAAGIQPPPTMQGRDLAPLYLSTTKPEWRDDFYYEHAIIRDKSFIPASQALVRKDMKYILWSDFGREQLFDRMADPFEETDLISEPSKKEILDELRARFAILKAGAR
jgi:arylsulfatase